MGVGVLIQLPCNPNLGLDWIELGWVVTITVTMVIFLKIQLNWSKIHKVPKYFPKSAYILTPPPPHNFVEYTPVQIVIIVF